MASPTTRQLSRHVWIARFRLRVSAGADAGRTFDSTGAEVTVGSDEGNDLRLSDSAVSRHHCVVTVTDEGIELRDLGSTNGTTLGGQRIKLGYVSPGGVIGVGETSLILEDLDEEYCEALSTEDHFGSVLGASTAMRRLYAIAERVAPAEATVLIEGETGTGKGALAESLHEASPRASGPFVVVDCGSIPPSLFEGEVFGYEKGAFTGAEDSRPGLIESANGGTVFLDEIGELPTELQPKLLRVLESKTVQRLGSSKSTKVNVRFIAATNRNLRSEVNAGGFRSDLWYRLATIRMTLPALDTRREDIPMLVDHFYRQFARQEGAPPPELIKLLQHRPWPGNVRELRSAVERMAIFESLDSWHTVMSGELGAHSADDDRSFKEAKMATVAAWELDYLSRLMARCGNNLSKAAREARMDRVHLRRLLRRHNLWGSG